MDDIDNYLEIFIQNGVQLIGATSSYMTYLNQVGTLYITEYSNKKKCIEWKPNDITVDSDIQEHEWAVVNTVQKRSRTLSESQPPDSNIKTKLLRIDFDDIKSYRTTNKCTQCVFFDGKSEPICSFLFQKSNTDCLISTLRGYLKSLPSNRDRHLYYVIDKESIEVQQLDKSFAELKLSPHDTWFKMFKNIGNHPFELSLDAFSKVTNYVHISTDTTTIQTLHDYETNNTQNDYEVIQKVPELPERKLYPRGRPLTSDQWISLHNNKGEIEDVDAIKSIISTGGIAPDLRNEVWKYLLDYYPWKSTNDDRKILIEQNKDLYYNVKLQWESFLPIQEDNFSEYRERKSLIEKDVNRTDRTLEFYAGENNENIQLLNDILMTYVMFNFDLGYVQGMSDLLSPILHVLRNEVDAFWCFYGFMNKIGCNFDIDQAGMKDQLQNLRILLGFIEPELVQYLEKHDSGNMFFCFRWILVWFKRELNEDDVLRVWEVLWTGLPCKNFLLLICVAILENEKQILIDNNYGFTEILKHINDLSGKLNIDKILSQAEGIFYQLKDAEHLTDNIRVILGLPILVCAQNKLLDNDIQKEEDFYNKNYNKMEHILT